MTPGGLMIHWCDLCGARPAEGFLTIIPTGETQPTTIMCCQSCVDEIDDDDWIENIDLHNKGVQP